MVYHYYSRVKVGVLENAVSSLQKFRVWILFACLLFAAAYFWQVNSLSTRGFKIRDLEKNIQTLRETNQKLELQAANSQSLEELEARIKGLNMAPPLKIEYLRPLGSGVAIK
ncbi:MAG: hypothetical protein HY982_01250 [Candidatus Magasanikbacteria bacterium]|nr:hypothetical protein [Candidatus Magasanikbacteria bacterium]